LYETQVQDDGCLLRPAVSSDATLRDPRTLDKGAHFCSTAKEASHETTFLSQNKGIDREIHDPGNASEDWLHRIGGARRMSVLRGRDFGRTEDLMLAMK
jgi:hypothetical protein